MSFCLTMRICLGITGKHSFLDEDSFHFNMKEFAERVSLCNSYRVKFSFIFKGFRTPFKGIMSAMEGAYVRYGRGSCPPVQNWRGAPVRCARGSCPLLQKSRKGIMSEGLLSVYPLAKHFISIRDFLFQMTNNYSNPERKTNQVK